MYHTIKHYNQAIKTRLVKQESWRVQKEPSDLPLRMIVVTKITHKAELASSGEILLFFQGTFAHLTLQLIS